MTLRIFTGVRGSKFVCDDSRGFGDAVATISRRADAPVNSCAREKAAEPLLKVIGKMSQAQLYACSLNCRPSCNGNCNPANPPGRSTHERRNDGAAYALPVGAWLAYWQRGIDVQRDRVSAFIREAAKEGWLVTQTYPASAAEAQHVNFRRAPKISVWEVRPLKRGMGKNVLDRRRLAATVRYLKRIQEPGERTPYLDPSLKVGVFGERVERAVTRFQSDHKLLPDGVVGLRTFVLLRGTARRPPSRLDAAGIKFLVEFEGEVLWAYNDPAGHATFGVGHLLHRGPVTPADAKTYGTKTSPKDPALMRRQSRALLGEDVKRFERAVMRYVPVRWRGSHDRFNALVSLAFNLGEQILTAAAPLTTFGAALKGKGVAGRARIAAAWLLYVHGRLLDADVVGDEASVLREVDSGSDPERVLPGLVRRRKAERALFLRNRKA